MFEKSLSDLIQGLRASKRNESQYIQTSLEEIQNEVQMSDMQYKSAAIDKLNYLHMLGYDMNWANFNIVEVMASSRFNEKRAGYLAATQSFHQETDVLMLTTNLIRKDLASSNVMEVSVALDGLAQIVTPEQATDLFEDVLAILGHSRPYIRKKALVCLYRLVLRYPEGLHAFVPQLKDALDDPDPSVVSSAVSVICELARINPHNYMPLAPKLYHLLNSSTNNWMRIKIVKLFASLTPIEPRLAKKLHGPLSQLIKATSAMSLLYECIHTAVVGDVISVPIPVTDNIGREIDFAELCAQNLVRFYESKDHNLCYVGLVTLAHLQAKRPDLVVDQYDTIIGCLEYPDLSIRMRALEVIAGMTTRRTLTMTVKRLMSQLILSNTVSLQPNNKLDKDRHATNSNDDDASFSLDTSGTSLVSAHGNIVLPQRMRKADVDPADSPEYRAAIVDSILDMCSRQSYSNMTNFEWYIATLVDLVYIAGVDVGQKLSDKLLDVTVRVRQVREYSVKMMRRLLSDKSIVEYITPESPNAKVLCTAAYILGEYCALLPAISGDIGLLLPASLTRLNGEQQAMFIQAATKVYTNWLCDVSGYWNNEVWELVRSVTSSTMSTLSALISSCADVEAKEATTTTETDSVTMHALLAAMPLQVSARLRQFFEITKAVSVATSNPSDCAPRICLELHSLFTTYELNPVSAAAQSKVPVPEGLDLDQPIGNPIPDRSRIVMPPSPKPQPRPRRHSSSHRDGKDGKLREDRKNGPFYLGGAEGSNARSLIDLPDVDDIPVVALDLSEERSAKTDKKNKKSKPRRSGKSAKSDKSRKSRMCSPSPPPISVDIAGDEDMPGAVADDKQQLPDVAATQKA
ncbi:AP-3 complex subunit delta [Coemansia asiatica]|uniref:AP-3 complex subunit delta n=1 Tax=Coemansia asiatica TaxID=1052880 RepID=A0A9W7XMA9_9FUNG|nr:AP-3 complex subunit delta [Coemansia asiatica]